MKYVWIVICAILFQYSYIFSLSVGINSDDTAMLDVKSAANGLLVRALQQLSEQVLALPQPIFS